MEQGHAPLDISLLIQKRSNYTDTHTPTKGQPLLSKRVSIGYLKELKEAQRSPRHSQKRLQRAMTRRSVTAILVYVGTCYAATGKVKRAGFSDVECPVYYRRKQS